MARKPRKNRYTVKNNYYIRQESTRGAIVRTREPTVAGAIMMCIVTIAILICIVTALGPVIDYFTNMLMEQPDNIYAAPVLSLMPWTYLIILLGVGVSIVLVWRTVIRHVWYDL